MAKASFTFVHRFIHDESGSYLVFLTILMPVLIGVAAFGTEGAQVLTLHRQAQAAADSAAVSVASYYAAQYTEYAAALSASPSTSTLPTQPTQTNLSAQGQAVAANYGFVNGTSGASVAMNNPPLSGNFTGANCIGTNNCAFEVIVSQLHSPLLSSYWLPSGMTVSARAVALINIANGPGANCALALGISSTGVANQANAITGAGNSPLNLKGCSIATNSNNANSITLSGSACINLVEENGYLGSRASTVGNYSFSGTASVRSCTSVSGQLCTGSTACVNPTPTPPLTSAGVTPDPYSGVTIPSPSLPCPSPLSLISGTPPAQASLCNGTNTGGLCFKKFSGSVTLNPGTYCGGINISKGVGTYTLNPGVYILATTSQSGNGSQGLVQSGGGTNVVNGTGGVTLVFTATSSTNYPTGSNPSPLMDIPGSMTLNLTAPTTGATAGFVIMGDRSMPLGTVGQNGTATGSQFVIENGATVTLNGTVYLPKGALTLDGNGLATANCSQIIANVIDLDNSGALDINCSTNGGGTAPVSLFGSVPLLVE
jgi:Flp pilus assembly protein TadG